MPGISAVTEVVAMRFLQKVKTFVTHGSAPAKFVAKTIGGVAIPGGAVGELIEKAIEERA